MKKMVTLIAILFLTGCAIGNKYSYEGSAVSMPMRASDEKVVILSVKDFRPYVLKGDKAPNFVGLQRGGFGNPFDVTTASGKSMTEEMTAAIEQGLKNAGYQVIATSGSPSMSMLKSSASGKPAARILILDVYDWKSDIYMSVTLHCDLKLRVYTSTGDLLAENSAKFIKAIGGGQIGADKNSQMVASEFSKQIGYLFSAKQIRDALE